MIHQENHKRKIFRNLVTHLTTWIGIVLSLFLVHPAYPIKVGIFGCAHGDQELLSKVLGQLKERDVEVIIGNGDFISFGGEGSLDNMVGLIPKLTSIPKERVFLMPGNWEHESGILPKKANAILSKYGQLITDKYDGAGVVEVGGKKIKVAHFPQHPVPGLALPPSEFIFRFFPGQAHLLLTMTRLQKAGSEVDLHVFGHTHVQAHFYDKESGKLVINAGGLDRCRKKREEINSYAVYNTETDEVQFYAAETGKPLTDSIPATRPEGFKGPSFDTGDYAICHEGFDRQKELEQFLVRFKKYK